jgi:hypothetical protein
MYGEHIPVVVLLAVEAPRGEDDRGFLVLAVTAEPAGSRRCFFDGLLNEYL